MILALAPHDDAASAGPVVSFVTPSFVSFVMNLGSQGSMTLCLQFANL
jgi:hypothetical protein